MLLWGHSCPLLALAALICLEGEGPVFRWLALLSALFHEWAWWHLAAAKSLQSCLTLCDPIDGSPPGSPVPGILQARTLEWVAISFSSAWKWKVKVKSQQSLTPSDPTDCSPPGSSIHGICQARVLEWVTIAFSNYKKLLIATTYWILIWTRTYARN